MKTCSIWCAHAYTPSQAALNVCWRICTQIKQKNWCGDNNESCVVMCCFSFVVFLNWQSYKSINLISWCNQSLGWRGSHHAVPQRRQANSEMIRFNVPTLCEQKDHTVTHTRSSVVTGCPERLLPTTMRASLFLMSSRLSARARMAMISLATAMSKPVWSEKKGNTTQRKPQGQKSQWLLYGWQLVGLWTDH